MKKLGLALVVLASQAFAAEVTGFWTGAMENRFGEAEDVSFRFVREGSSITGKLYGDADSTPVQDVKIEGDQITFTILFEMNGAVRKWSYSGVIAGREIRMQRIRVLLPGDPKPQNPIQPQTFTLKKIL